MITKYIFYEKVREIYRWDEKVSKFYEWELKKESVSWQKID